MRKEQISGSAVFKEKDKELLGRKYKLTDEDLGSVVGGKGLVTGLDD